MRRRMRLRKVDHDALPQFAALLIHVSDSTSQALSNECLMENVVAAFSGCFLMLPLTKLIASDLNPQKSRDQRSRSALT
jgi:hypothetical protein